MVGGGQVGHRGAGGGQGRKIHTLGVQGNRAAGRAALSVHLADLGIARVLRGEHRAGPQQLGQQQIEVLRAGAHDDLLRRDGHAPVVPQIVGNGPAQGLQALVGHRPQQGGAVLAEHLPGEPGPGGDGKGGGVHLVALQIKPPLPGGLRHRNGRRLRRFGRGGAVHLGDEKAPLGQGVEVSLRLQLGVGSLHGDDRQVQMLRQGTLGGQPLPCRQFS